MFRAFLVVVIMLFATSSCVPLVPPSSPLSTSTPVLSPIEAPIRSVATMTTSLPMVNPSTALVPQLIDDLAKRLNISQDQIVLQKLWLLKWEASAVSCPVGRRSPKFSQEQVMIVGDDGVKYEASDRNTTPSNTTVAVDLGVGNTVYTYYVVDGHVLFCLGAR